jgi:hypothetical protein
MIGKRAYDTNASVKYVNCGENAGENAKMMAEKKSKTRKA